MIKTTAPILTKRIAYKPFEYPEFFDYYRLQQQAHWLPTEVPMADDVADFNSKLTKAEKNLITQILRFFTQGDLEVMNNYNSNLIQYFPKPEIAMMLTAFASIETVHVWAYSQLNDTLGLPEEDYTAFLDYKEMKDKYDYLHIYDFDSLDIAKLAKNLAVFGGFMEGMSLFSSFAILLNFPRRGLLKNVGQIIAWSQIDERGHSDGICSLFKHLTKETGILETNPELKDEIYQACYDMVVLEDNFIDLCYEQGPVEGLTTDQLKQYIRYLADDRLKALGLLPKFGIKANPLPWVTNMVYGKEFSNFFETRATEYSKGSIQGDFF